MRKEAAWFTHRAECFKEEAPWLKEALSFKEALWLKEAL